MINVSDGGHVANPTKYCNCREEQHSWLFLNSYFSVRSTQIAILDSRLTWDFSPVSTIHCRHKCKKNMAASGLTSAEHRLWTISSSECTGNNRYSFFHLIRPKGGCQRKLLLLWFGLLFIALVHFAFSYFPLIQAHETYAIDLRCLYSIVMTFSSVHFGPWQYYPRFSICENGRQRQHMVSHNHLHLWSLYSSPIYSSLISTSLHYPYQSSVLLLPHSLTHPPPTASWAFLLFATASSSPSLYCSLSSSSTSSSPSPSPALGCAHRKKTPLILRRRLQSTLLWSRGASPSLNSRPRGGVRCRSKATKPFARFAWGRWRKEMRWGSSETVVMHSIACA